METLRNNVIWPRCIQMSNLPKKFTSYFEPRLLSEAILCFASLLHLVHPMRTSLSAYVTMINRGGMCDERLKLLGELLRCVINDLDQHTNLTSPQNNEKNMMNFY